jgi:outer membrane protein TolC
MLQPIELQSDAGGWTPEQIAVIAVIVNPDLRAERDRRQLASAQVLQAGLLPNPTVTAGVDFPYDASPPDDHTAYSFGVDWEITSLITHDLKRRAASAEAASVDLDVAWKEWQIAQEARTAAYDVLALQGQLNAAREAERQLADNLAAVQRAADRHEKTLLDLAAAQNSAQDAHEVVIVQERDLAKQRLTLQRAVGFPPDRPIALRGSDADLPASLPPPAHESMLSGLEQRRLDMLALKKGYESQDATLRAAILMQFPKIMLGGSVARDTMGIKTVGPSAAIEIPLFDRGQGVIATENATRQKLFDEYVSRVFAAQSDVAGAIADIRSSNAQIAAAQAALPTLENLVKTYDAALGQGNVDVLSAYSAKSALAQKRIEVIKLKQQLMQSWIALELASGQHLPLGSPGEAAR